MNYGVFGLINLHCLFGIFLAVGRNPEASVLSFKLQGHSLKTSGNSSWLRSLSPRERRNLLRRRKAESLKGLLASSPVFYYSMLAGLHMFASGH